MQQGLPNGGDGELGAEPGSGGGCSNWSTRVGDEARGEAGKVRHGNAEPMRLLLGEKRRGGAGRELGLHAINGGRDSGTRDGARAAAAWRAVVRWTRERRARSTRDARSARLTCSGGEEEATRGGRRGRQVGSTCQ